MSAYDNDPRVRRDDVGGVWWVVSWRHGDAAVVDVNEDGIFHAFDHEVRRNGVGLGRELNVPPSDFDTVVHALIGDPR